MDLLIASLVLAVPALAAWVILWNRKEMRAQNARPYREGEVRPWEVEAMERAERRRANAIIEEELMRRAA